MKKTKIDADRLGVTPTGRAWCQKALNPSDDVQGMRGIPDVTNIPTVQLNYMQTVTIQAPTADKLWEGECYFFTDPVNPMSYFERDVDNGNPAVLTVLNSSLGNLQSNAITAWRNLAQAWRPVYYGATVYLDAPAVANQGSIVAAQYCGRPRSFGRPSIGNDDGEITVAENEMIAWQEQDTAEYDTLIKMPNAYTGLAVDGCYLPLKLDADMLSWHDERDICMQCDLWTEKAAGTYIIPTAAKDPSAGLYPGVTTAWYNAGVDAGWWQGSDTFRPCTSRIGCVAFRGVSDQATVRIVLRYGFEVMVQPDSNVAPFQQSSAVHDRQSLDYYFAISQALRDAYPAEYNDLGKLWDVISKIAAVAAPLVRMIPVAGPAIEAAGQAIGRAVNVARKRKAAAKPRTQPKPPSSGKGRSS